MFFSFLFLFQKLKTDDEVTSTESDPKKILG